MGILGKVKKKKERKKKKGLIELALRELKKVVLFQNENRLLSAVMHLSTNI